MPITAQPLPAQRPGNDIDAIIADLLPPLQRLDRLLEAACRRAPDLHGPDAESDLYRGLYVDANEVQRLLRRSSVESLFAENGVGRAEADDVPAGSCLAWLGHAYNLSTFDLDVIVLALAPELDRRYERIYAYLQDHVSRRWPTVDLALHLFCADAGARLAQRRRFAAGAPLLRYGLVELAPDRGQTPATLLSHIIKLDAQVVDFLLDQHAPDRRVARFCRLVPPPAANEPGVDELAGHALAQLVAQAQDEARPLYLYLEGPDPEAKRLTAAAAAAELEMSLLWVDVPAALAAKLAPEELWSLLCRTAWFEGAVSYWDGIDVTQTNEIAALLEALGQTPGPAILAGAERWPVAHHSPIHMLPIACAAPDFTQRRDCWRRHLARQGWTLAAADLDALADRFRLTRRQISAAVTSAQQQAQWRAVVEEPTEDRNQQRTEQLPGVAQLFAAARAQSGQRLDALARKIEPRAAWVDIILPPETLDQLHAICRRVEQRPRVLGAWGFDRKLARGKGVTALFAGPSGAGKTMAAEIIAQELGLDLYQIDLSGVVSKYIGETEKNLNQVFAAAESGNAILFFDEADALFGKRSAVSDAHDRYANIEISYLLQKMEEYDGIAILATNLRQNLDDAFLRRLAFAVHFPFPDAESRRRIWSAIWPPETPLAADVDAVLLAERYKLSGGNIKNVALAAAFLAAHEGSPVRMMHLHRAAEREFEKIGKLPPSEMSFATEETS
jgi:hypothetical protein